MKTTGITLTIVFLLYFLLFFDFELTLTTNKAKHTVTYQGAVFTLLYWATCNEPKTYFIRYRSESLIK